MLGIVSMELSDTTSSFAFYNSDIVGSTASYYLHQIDLSTSNQVYEMTIRFLASDQSVITFMTIGSLATNPSNISTGSGPRSFTIAITLAGGQTIDLTHEVLLVPFINGVTISKGSSTG